MPSPKRAQALAALERLNAEIDERLRSAQTRVQELQAELEEAKQVRSAVVEEALGEGWSQARVGRSMGLTRQRVAQIRGGQDD
jgi:chromosome segregation ATPase